MSSSITETAPLSFAKLQPQERVLCSVVLFQVQPAKMFAFFGPVTYQPNHIRYHGHLTNKRFILEVYPYSSGENLAVKAILAVGKVVAPNPGFAIGQGIQYGLAKMAMNDPDLKTTSIPYSEITSVAIVKSLGFAKHIRLSIKGADDFHFNVFPHKAGDTILQNFAPAQIKENFLFAEEFCELFKSQNRKW